MTSSKPSYLPKPPPPDTVPQRDRMSTYEFWRDTVHYVTRSATAHYNNEDQSGDTGASFPAFDIRNWGHGHHCVQTLRQPTSFFLGGKGLVLVAVRVKLSSALRSSLAWTLFWQPGEFLWTILDLLDYAKTVSRTRKPKWAEKHAEAPWVRLRV